MITPSMGTHNAPLDPSCPAAATEDSPGNVAGDYPTNGYSQRSAGSQLSGGGQADSQHTGHAVHVEKQATVAHAKVQRVPSVHQREGVDGRDVHQQDLGKEEKTKW